MRCLFLISVLTIILIPSPSLYSAENITLQATDGTTVTIRRDSYGVPHITAETETGVFFGQGFAVAQDRLFQMELHRRAAQGKLSEWFGSLTMETDRQTLTMFYTQQERKQQFQNLSPEIQNMLQAYTDGVNTYLDSMTTNPEKYQPSDFNYLEMEPWTVHKSMAVAQFLTRIFGQAGGQELQRLGELQANGQEWFDENRPINDPSAPTTIRDGETASFQEWSYSGLRIRPEVVRRLEQRQQELSSAAKEVGIPSKFGSFAVLISPTKSALDGVMLLGAPQMGEPRERQTNITHEVELICPTLHVGGMTVAGVPLVIIGHTEHHAWTLTSGVSDNSDVYIETTENASFERYRYDGKWQDFEVITSTLDSLGTRVAFTHYRSVHGPVFAADLANLQAYSLKMTFWNREFDMAEAIYRMIKARNLEEFEAAAHMFPFSFNLHYAGKDQKIKFWHVGKYQDRSDGVDPRLPHNGDGSEEWGGFIPFEQLPQADGTMQDYFVNWNNKPVSWWNNGDNIPWAGSTSQTLRVTAIESYVGPIASFSFANLKDVPRQINSHGTYQQVVAFKEDEILDENIIPPGQSAFKDINYQRSPHMDDQWPLHVNWQFKDMEFADNVVTSIDSDDTQPAEFGLLQNYPNPFNPVTTIAYRLQSAGEVTLEIYNIRGQWITTLVDAFQQAGRHEVQWNADNLGSGIYLYKIRTADFSDVGKTILLK